MPQNVTQNQTNCDWLFDVSVKWLHGRALTNECSHILQTPDLQPSVWRSGYVRLPPHLHSIVITNALSMYKETLQWWTMTLWPHFEWTKCLYSFYFSHEPMEYSMLLMRSVHTAHHLSWSLTQHFIQCTQRNSRQPKWLSLTITKPNFYSGL